MSAGVETISSALFGKTRRVILAILFSHPDEDFFLRQIARASGAGMGAAQRELKRLTEAGILQRSVRIRQVFYRANPDCPVFQELRGLIRKTSGAAEVIRSAIEPLAARIQVCFIHGSLARGEERAGSDLDLLVIGGVKFREVVACIGPIQSALRREINPTVFSPREFRTKVRAGNHFLTTVLKGAKILLVGDEDELAGLAR